LSGSKPVSKLYFEDFKPGLFAEYGPRPISREEIVAFAAEFDPQPIWTNFRGLFRMVDQGHYDKAINLYYRALLLVTDSKWRSVVKWWISQAKSKSQHPSERRARAERGRSHLDNRPRR